MLETYKGFRPFLRCVCVKAPASAGVFLFLTYELPYFYIKHKSPQSGASVQKEREVLKGEKSAV